jgi:hypothetical protein
LGAEALSISSIFSIIERVLNLENAQSVDDSFRGCRWSENIANKDSLLISAHSLFFQPMLSLFLYMV